MKGSYTKIYRACFLAPMHGPHHFAALLEGGGQRVGGGRGGSEKQNAGAVQGGLEISNWVSAPLYEMPAPRHVSSSSYDMHVSSSSTGFPLPCMKCLRPGS